MIGIAFGILYLFGILWLVFSMTINILYEAFFFFAHLITPERKNYPKLHSSYHGSVRTSYDISQFSKR